jgi:radical SAM protein with 4Fe4S-binding SPASM domain
MTEQTLPFEIAKAGIELFFSENDSRHIRFYGPGEPTQEIGLMKKIVEYAQQIARDQVTVELQTNGVFNEQDRIWLLNNVNIFWVSFDGEPIFHDAQRHFPNGNPTSPLIEKNVKWLLEHKANQKLMVGARVTITNENMNWQKEMIDYFYSLGIIYIWSDPLFPCVGTIPAYEDEEKMNSFAFDMDKYVDKYIEASRYADKRGIFYGSFLTCNFDGKTNRHCRACIPVPHFTPDGYISACDLVSFGENANHMECFVYGKWNPVRKKFDIFEEKLKTLQSRTTNNMEHCRQCFAQEHCGGYCLGEVVNETGDLFGQKTITCVAIRKLFKELGTSKALYPFMHP